MFVDGQRVPGENFIVLKNENVFQNHKFFPLVLVVATECFFKAADDCCLVCALLYGGINPQFFYQTEKIGG